MLIEDALLWSQQPMISCYPELLKSSPPSRAHSGPRPLIQFRNHFSQTVGLLGLGISPSQGRYVNTGQHKHRINAYTHQISMPWMGFEPTIPASERGKTVHDLEPASSVTGPCFLQTHIIIIVVCHRVLYVDSSFRIFQLRYVRIQICYSNLPPISQSLKYS
jgi:hypothetical protein